MTDDANRREKQIQTAGEWFRRHKIIVIAIGALLLLTVTISSFVVMMPMRSRESFCQLIVENKSLLLSLDASYQKKLDIYKKLERVAPEDMREDMGRVVKGYQSIVDRPETALSTEFGIMGEMRRFSDYMNNKCSEK